MKKFFFVIMVTIFILSAFGSTYAFDFAGNSENVKIIINGAAVNNETLPVWDNYRLLVPAEAVFKDLDAQVNYNPQIGLIEITKGNTNISLLIGDRSLKINDRLIKMDASSRLYNGVPMVPVRFVAEALNQTVTWNDITRSVTISDRQKEVNISNVSDEKKYLVVIDPGHGGSDPGAIYGDISEKSINLDIAKELNKLLQNKGVKTIMTRVNDTYVGLYERSEIANKNKADLLISIHNNADQYKGTNGSMSLYYPNGGNSNGKLTAKLFADIVQSKLTNSLKTGNLGSIARPRLAVLRTAYMPAVIAEVGYMSNSGELKKLKSDTFKQNAAKALLEAVIEALHKI